MIFKKAHEIALWCTIFFKRVTYTSLDATPSPSLWVCVHIRVPICISAQHTHEQKAHPISTHSQLRVDVACMMRRHCLYIYLFEYSPEMCGTRLCVLCSREWCVYHTHAWNYGNSFLYFLYLAIRCVLQCSHCFITARHHQTPLLMVKQKKRARSSTWGTTRWEATSP